MLSEKRIKEAEVNVKSYLSEGLMKKEQFNSLVYNILINNSNESIETAAFLANNKKSSLWIIVSAYYSMFYMANAVIYKLGYKIGDKIAHKVTNDALIVYVRNKLKQKLSSYFFASFKVFSFNFFLSNFLSFFIVLIVFIVLITIKINNITRRI